MHIAFRCDPALIGTLPRPYPARKGLPDWIRSMPANAFSQTHGQDVRTVKQCPPFIDAMTHGFMMPLPCDVHVHEGVFSWSWDLAPLSIETHPRAPLSFHVPAQVQGTPFFEGSRTVVKFNSFWTIELEPGYSLFATHPVNRADLPFRLLTGMVDADRFSEVGILFPAVWLDPGFSGVLPAGTPIAQCFPVLRDSMSLGFEALDEHGKKRYDALASALLSKPGVYRRRYRVARGRSTPK